MARDYEAELLEIEKNRQANNERTRADGLHERNQLESAIKEYPEHEPLYREEIDGSRKREEAFVASNDKTAAGKSAEVESDRNAEAEAAKAASEVKLVEPPPPPVNDNSSNPNAILATRTPERTPDESNSPAAAEPEHKGIFSSMHESGLVEGMKNTMNAVGIANSLGGAVHPFGTEAEALMAQLNQQQPGVERSISADELKSAGEQLASAPPGHESVQAAPPSPPVSGVQVLDAIDKHLDEKASKFVPQEEKPKERMQHALEDGQKSADALQTAAENAPRRSAADLIPPQEATSPANDNIRPPPPPPPPPHQTATYEVGATFGPPG